MFEMMTTADACVGQTVKDCIGGQVIRTPKDVSRELLYYSTGMAYPRARVMTNPARPLNIVVALARFTWMVSGNNRVEDIAYYEPKVRGFSDDGLTVPGSDYGLRIFQPRPGLNQVQGVVDRLRQNPLNRQSAVVVWQPEDAVRQSSDIPCTFGMFFHIRHNEVYGHPELHMCVNMRSNNAFRILPFNLFEFTMLQELVAAELDVQLGKYHHWAASMHVYENEREWPATLSVADNFSAGNGTMDPIVMPEMPTEAPMLQAQTMARFEAQLRHACNEDEVLMVLERAVPMLDPYWHGLLSVLTCWTAAKHGMDAPYYAVPDDFRDLTQVACQKAYAHN